MRKSELTGGWAKAGQEHSELVMGRAQCSAPFTKENPNPGPTKMKHHAAIPLESV